MPQDNIATVRRFYRSWSDRDLDGVLELVAQDVEIDWSGSHAPFQGVYKGHGGLMQFWRNQTEAWESFRVEVIEAIECGPDCLVAVTRVRGRGRGSGISVEAGGASLWRLQNGALASVKLFQHKDDALKAAGLSEQDAHADS
jgi:ketosteroid isomerase-like protein